MAEPGPAPGTNNPSDVRDAGASVRTDDVPLVSAVLTTALIVSVLVGYGWCVATQTYVWPFSPHAMYKGLQGPVYSTPIVMGVSHDGEFKLLPKHVRPYNFDMLRAMFSKARGAERDRSVATVAEVYARNRGRFPDDSSFADLTGIRIYSGRWNMVPGAKIKATPKHRKLTSAAFVTSGALLLALAEQRDAPAAATQPLPTPKGDWVFELQADDQGTIRGVLDERASQGKAVQFKAGARPLEPGDNYLTLQFDAPKGRYAVWLRGTGKKQGGSVWMQATRPGDDAKSVGKKGLGQFQVAYPPGLFGWSSASPELPPVVVEFKQDGPQELRLLPREGSITLDQVWLSRERFEIPPFTRPLNAMSPATSAEHDSIASNEGDGPGAAGEGSE